MPPEAKAVDPATIKPEIKQNIPVKEMTVVNGEATLNLKLGEISRGRGKGWKYFQLALPTDKEEALKLLQKFYGAEKLVEDILEPAFNTRLQKYMDEAAVLTKVQVIDPKTGKMVEEEEETGDYNLEEIGPMLIRLSARGDSVATIRTKLLEVAAQMTTLPFDSDPVGAAATAQKIVARMNALRSDLENKRRKTAEDKEEEKLGAVPATV